MDEHVILDGKGGYLKFDLLHESKSDLDAWIAKHNRYATENAREYYRILREGISGEMKGRLFGNQAERKRFLKERIWVRLPGRGLLWFLYLYLFRLGFLDGLHGLRFCVMQGVFQHFVSMKLWELRYYKKDLAEHQ